MVCGTDLTPRELTKKIISFLSGILGIVSTALTATDEQKYKNTVVVLTAVIGALNLFTATFVADVHTKVRAVQAKPPSFAAGKKI